MTKTSGSSSRSSGLKTRALKKKAKLAELEAEKAFLVRREITDNRARARTKIFEESELDIKFIIMINRSVLDLFKIFTKPALLLAIIKEECDQQHTVQVSRCHRDIA